MKSSRYYRSRARRKSNLLRLGLLATLLVGQIPFNLSAQNATPAAPDKKNPSEPARPQADAPPAPPPVSADKPAPAPATSSTNEIQVSFQGANIDMIVQWLAQNTGKSVIKHPQVNCQLTIVSSKKVTPRQAIDLIYHALSLEGFSAVESSDSILIVPEGKEPKLSPPLIDAAHTAIPEGRQRVIKMFALKHVHPEDIREKIRPALSDKGTLDSDDRANQLIVTDYTDNLRLAAELIDEMDVVTSSEITVETYNLKHGDAEEVGSLLGMILSARHPESSGGSRPSHGGGGNPGGGPPGMQGMPGMPGGPGGGSSGDSGGGGSSNPLQVHVWPDKTGNRLIISAPQSQMSEVRSLLDILDSDKSEDVTMRVISLKNVNAEDLVKEIGPLYQRLNGRSQKDKVELAYNDRANSIIVLSSEANYRALSKVIESLDTEDAQEKVVQTFQLKNADAQDTAKQLQELFRDSGSINARYYYSFSGNDNSAKRKLSVVADRRRNTLIVQAPPAQMPAVEKMIKTLDEPVSDQGLAPKIYPMKYVSAVDIEDVLNELFLKKQPQRNYYDYFFSDEPQGDTSDRDVGRLYGKVRITSEPYSNSIILTSNSPESVAAVEEVLKKLDVPSQAGETTVRINLRFAKASTVANSINVLFAKGGSPPLRGGQQQQQQPQQQQQQQQGAQQNSTTSQKGFDLEQEAKEDEYYPWIGGQPENSRNSEGRNTTRPVSDLIGRVRVVPDQRSNALMVSANMHFFPEVLKLIEDLDAPTPQVLIEARIVEVSSNFLDQLGVRWSPNGTAGFSADDMDNSLIAHGAGEYVKQFGPALPSFGPNNQGSSTALSLANSLHSGVLDSTMNLDFLVQFLKRTIDATVLAEPQINIADNEVGKLFVGSQVPFQDSSQTYNTGGLTKSFSYRDVGVKLEVTPHINSNGEVQLKIHAESSTLEPSLTPDGNYIIDTRNFRTELVARNGETLVMGGIIQKQISDTVRKTPVLGDIPGLGWAFKKKDKSTKEVELIAFLRPRIVRTAAEAQQLLEETDKNAPLVRKWREGNPNAPRGDAPVPPPGAGDQKNP